MLYGVGVGDEEVVFKGQRGRKRVESEKGEGGRGGGFEDGKASRSTGERRLCLRKLNTPSSRGFDLSPALSDPDFRSVSSRGVDLACVLSFGSVIRWRPAADLAAHDSIDDYVPATLRRARRRRLRQWYSLAEPDAYSPLADPRGGWTGARARRRDRPGLTIGRERVDVTASTRPPRSRKGCAPSLVGAIYPCDYRDWPTYRSNCAFSTRLRRPPTLFMPDTTEGA